MLQPTLFDIQDDVHWKEHLIDEGYVVIRNVMSEEDIVKAFKFFVDDMKTVSPNFNPADPKTHAIEFTPMMFAKGMAVFNGFGNSDFMWYLRTNPSIKNIYERLYDTKDLCVSMDGFSMFVSSKQTPGSWLHTDQHPKDEILSVQGAYNFLPVNESCSGFIVIPKSHKTFVPEIDAKGDWIIYDKVKKQGFEKLESEVVKLLIPENCFVLWNSKTIHANTGIVKKPRAKAIYRFDRLTCWITYLPRALTNEDVMKKRINAYKNGETTSHWSNRCEIKKYPYGFGPTYESRGFGKIQPKLEEDGTIPKERLDLL
jgi:ectoine hydroxylase-related dioxygenase (phytanoyl-CoA dioxygenase family)